MVDRLMTNLGTWVELHRHFGERWKSWGDKAWETLKLNQLLSSALTALAIYSIIYVYTNEFLASTRLYTMDQKALVRLTLPSIPSVLLYANLKLKGNFRRQGQIDRSSVNYYHLPASEYTNMYVII